jgi:hypothetical protein
MDPQASILQHAYEVIVDADIFPKSQNGRVFRLLFNRVYADLIFSMNNVDGFKNERLTCPSGKIQIQLLEEFYKDIDIDPKTIDYVESYSTKVCIIINLNNCVWASRSFA